MTANRVTFLIPASGASARFADGDKLEMPLFGTTVLGTVLNCALSLAPLEVLVVSRSKRVVPAGCHLLINPEPDAGLSGSIAIGAINSHRGAAGILVWPADLPLVRPETVIRILRHGSESTITRPVIEMESGAITPGHPVLFGSAFRSTLIASTSGPGARQVLIGHPGAVRSIPVDDPGVVQDIDTVEDYHRIHGRAHA